MRAEQRIEALERQVSDLQQLVWRDVEQLGQVTEALAMLTELVVNPSCAVNHQ